MRETPVEAPTDKKYRHQQAASCKTGIYHERSGDAFRQGGRSNNQRRIEAKTDRTACDLEHVDNSACMLARDGSTAVIAAVVIEE